MIAVMIRQRAQSSWQAIGLAVALFAITLNFLQPLAHAAMMRDGAPGALWTAFCKPAATPDDTQNSAPGAAKKHECCLGLTHATPLAAPPTAFVFVAPVSLAIAPSLPAERPTAVAIRDGPSRPRGPPAFV